jgi:hypothetical protein
MLDRDQPQKRRILQSKTGRAIAVTGIALLSVSPFFAPSQASASEAARAPAAIPELQAEEGEILEDESLLEPLSSEALVIGEEDEMSDMLRIGLNQMPDCQAQFRVTAQQWWINRSIANRAKKPDGSAKFNNGDGIGPWVNKVFRASGFPSFTRTVLGISTRNGEGDALFNNESSQKPPARVVEFRGRSDLSNRMPIRVVREGGETKSALVPCGRLQRFPYLLQVKTKGE